jgi:hypothetical protein
MDFSPWTAQVNGSTTAMARSHLGRPETGEIVLLGEEQQRIQYSEDGAQHQGIFDPHHHKEHHGVEGDGCRDDEQKEKHGGHRVKDDAHTSEQRANHSKTDAGEHRLDGAP